MDFLTDTAVAKILRELRGNYPDLEIETHFVFSRRVWLAQARAAHAHPWLAMSTDLDRFRRSLGPPPEPPEPQP